MSARARVTKTPQRNPLIPERFIDVPTQRLYYLTLGSIFQAVKLFDFLWSLAATEARPAAFRKWVVVDILYCLTLVLLRLPRLQYSKSTVALQISALCLVDAIMFGGIIIDFPTFFGFSHGNAELAATSTSLLSTLSLGLLGGSKARDGNLLGQHTVRMSPISTAQLNPQTQTFCLSSTSDVAHIPIVLNNTDLAGIKYSISPLGGNGKVEYHDVSGRELKSYTQTFSELQATSQATVSTKEDEEYEYDDDDDADTDGDASPSLQNTESRVYLPIRKPGIIRLERVYDVTNNNARLALSDAVVVPCPIVSFADDDTSVQQTVRCEGDVEEPQLKINVYGVPPLSIKWLRTVDNHREEIVVDGIEGEQRDESDRASVGMPQHVKIPLSVPLQHPGTYIYALEEVTDAVGNRVQVGGGEALSFSAAQDASHGKTKYTRFFMVLRKPAISFRGCSVDTPSTLLVGSTTRLAVKALVADPLDGPWDITLNYQPALEADGTVSKKFKPWKKTLKLSEEKLEVGVETNSPGEFHIAGVKGKYCTGVVLAPDTCRVHEIPIPQAQIEWKRIHECSGDTGVSASLILRGTPPFQVVYRIQRDKEPPRDVAKTFTTSRAELTIQPERSGHYAFTFMSISDSHYRKIELNGPSIEQIIHPVASAQFADTHDSRRPISTCSGDTVDVDISLRGTAPWTVGFQIIGPQTLESFEVSGIGQPQKRITIPIPKELRKSSGNFEINMVSVEDASKCKRTVSVRGLPVKVKRVVPTAQFYGKKQDRHILTTESDGAKLPLRLTGDGPWVVHYRMHSSPQEYAARIQGPNDNLQVKREGVVELTRVSDAQCPGSIVADSNTFEVAWIPRPTAKITPGGGAYEAHNGSYILPAVCQDANAHVDLELSGRPPFQIVYNVAQNNELGGTKLLEQSTHNSIQSRTRFTLKTDAPGRIYYEVKQIGDGAYALSGSIPRSQRLLFEQQVSVKPSARFHNANPMVYCLNDALIPQSTSSTDGLIILEGTPPFLLDIVIRNLASSHIDRQTVQVSTNSWKLDLPHYSFSSIGPHRVTLQSVKDSSNCAPAKLDLSESIRIDVAETAAIIPFERRQDICVGEMVQFQLEGIPPWTISYKTNGRQSTQEVKSAPFSFAPQQAGSFSITSIAHQQKMCKAAVSDLQYKVHALPSASVGHGKKVFQDIHEGDQAEIAFTLVGEPPFTFTYQRSELPTKKGGTPKVLETHTVSRISTYQYSIFSALEGTWTVTSISDKYCRYPPTQPDLSDQSLE